LVQLHELGREKKNLKIPKG